MIEALGDEIEKITPPLDVWTEKREELGESFDPDCEEFVKLHADYERFVLAVGSYADTAILMAAITMESLINKFCIYNLHRDIIEPLEKLSPSEKLIVASAIMGYPGFRAHSAHEAAKKLTQWRNSFAHGHCVERPSREIMKNHLTQEETSILDREAPIKIKTLKEMIGRFIRVFEYIGEMSRNPYVTEDEQVNVERIRELLVEIQQYHFTNDEYPYEIKRKTKSD